MSRDEASLPHSVHSGKKILMGQENRSLKINLLIRKVRLNQPPF